LSGSGAAIDTTSSRFIPLSGTGNSLVEASVSQAFPVTSCTLDSMFAAVDGADLGADSIDVTLRVDGVSSGTVTCTITGATKTCSNNSLSGTLTLGELLNWQVTSATGGTRRVRISLRCI
jgi:hypothetical protein